MARIAFVSDVVYPWVKGGMESIHYLEMNELAENNEVYCFCMQFDGMKKEFFSDGVHYIGVAKASSDELYTEKGTRSIALARKFARSLPGALGHYSFDLVYANSFPYLHLGAVKAYCKAHKCRLALDVAEVWDIKRWKSYIGKVKGVAAYHYARNALRGADFYIANSSATAKELEKAGIQKGRITILSPVIELEKMLKISKQLRKLPVVAYAGRLIKEKRLDLWVESVAKAHALDNRIKGLIIGSGPEEANVRRLIKKYHFIAMRKPYSSKAQLYKAVGSSMCMLNMSEREGLSTITIESAALGTIPVLPDYTPIPEEVKTLSIVKSVEDIPKVIASIASGKIKYRIDREKLERFDVGRVGEAFERMLGH
ncbi:MAG: glycosyltransferase [Candidatus Micrarchaeales archaeon]|jgi:glycosyltransferase involved in cell wall biosynthesis|nr:glycosyltransferase [Candidatus Micrarchaeales archaeon]